MQQTVEDRLGVGGNLPPTDAEILHESLTEKHLKLVERRDELLAAVLRVPETVDDDEADKVLSDFISKQLRACIKNAEALRVEAKEPHLSAGRTVDGFFKAVMEPLGNAIIDLERRLTIYKRQKTDRERLARREAARLADERAAQAAKEATDQAAAAQTQADLDNAIVAEEAANQAKADAATAAKAATAKPADLSRTRGDYGSVSSLITFMDFKELDRATLDLESLRHHLPETALEQAVRAFVKAGGRELRGVTIFENTRTGVR